MIKLEAKFGYSIHNKTTDTYHKLVYLPDNANVDNFEEVMLVDKQSKNDKILQSKINLANYLENNPLFSRCKYEDGRYYNVTLEKQNLLLANISTYQMSLQAGIPCPLTWNDTGNECEIWTFEELFRLSLEIREYVHPLTSMQQHMESNIKSCVTKKELDNVNIEFNEKNINEYYPIYLEKLGDLNEE